MRFGNILAQKGGTAETGRPVRFQIRQKVAAGKGVKKWCDAVILPLGEDERAGAIAAARTYCAENAEADPEQEKRLRLVQRFLHDPQDLRVKWAAEAELPQLRLGLVVPQVDWLLGEYDRHIEAEYPELAPPSKKEELEEQIRRLNAQIKAMAEEAAGE